MELSDADIREFQELYRQHIGHTLRVIQGGMCAW